MNSMLTPLQAFYVMQEFIERYFKTTSSDSFGALLSCMQFLEDDQTADPALWEDWKTVIGVKKHVTPMQGFEAMYIFLHNYYRDTSSNTVKKMLNDIDDVINNEIKKHVVWSSWMECINLVKNFNFL